jgi:hypothetical protein
LQIPENQLQLLTPHQARVQKSLEKLSLPNWYKPVNSSPANHRFIQANSYHILNKFAPFAEIYFIEVTRHRILAQNLCNNCIGLGFCNQLIFVKQNFFGF